MDCLVVLSKKRGAEEKHRLILKRKAKMEIQTMYHDRWKNERYLSLSLVYFFFRRDRKETNWPVGTKLFFFVLINRASGSETLSKSLRVAVIKTLSWASCFTLNPNCSTEWRKKKRKSRFRTFVLNKPFSAVGEGVKNRKHCLHYSLQLILVSSIQRVQEILGSCTYFCCCPTIRFCK